MLLSGSVTEMSITSASVSRSTTTVHQSSSLPLLLVTNAPFCLPSSFRLLLTALSDYSTLQRTALAPMPSLASYCCLFRPGQFGSAFLVLPASSGASVQTRVDIDRQVTCLKAKHNDCLILVLGQPAVQQGQHDMPHHYFTARMSPCTLVDLCLFSLLTSVSGCVVIR